MAYLGLDLNMTQTLFNELLCNMTVTLPATFSTGQCSGDQSTMTYIGDAKFFQKSLSMPSTAKTVSEIQYAVFFVAPTDYESDVHAFYQTFKNELLVLMALMVVGATIVLFLVIWCIIVSFSKQITSPMVILTQFTNQMKKT
jgi:sensor histidine kinase YesM